MITPGNFIISFDYEIEYRGVEKRSGNIWIALTIFAQFTIHLALA